MPFAWRKRRPERATAGAPVSPCEHVWKPRDLTVALHGSSGAVCELCGAVRIVDEEPGRPAEEQARPTEVADPLTSRPAGEVHALTSLFGQDREARHASARPPAHGRPHDG